MINWFNSFDDFFKGVIVIAGASTILMIIQIIMLIIGMSEDAFDGAECEMDFDGFSDSDSFFDLFGLRILTLRNLIAFFSIGGWSMLVFQSWFGLTWLSLLLGIGCGLITMVLLSFALKKMNDLQSNGAIDITNAIGKTGTVYLTIPANRGGFGKINVIVQERYIEVDAVTNGERLLTGTEIKVVDAVIDHLIVEKLQE